MTLSKIGTPKSMSHLPIFEMDGIQLVIWSVSIRYIAGVLYILSEWIFCSSSALSSIFSFKLDRPPRERKLSVSAEWF